MGREVTRRAFLAGAATAGGAAAVADSATAQAEPTVVDMTDGLVFDPAEVFVEPGTEVVWENVGGVGHSVTAYEDEIPDGADYWASGRFDSEQAARAAYPDRGDVPGGDAYSRRFQTEGTHEYFCIPHESVGMVGSVVVTTDPPETGGFESVLPNSAQDLAIGLTAALVTVLGLAYVFMRYGGDYEEIAGDEEA